MVRRNRYRILNLIGKIPGYSRNLFQVRQQSQPIAISREHERAKVIGAFFDAEYWLRLYPRFGEKSASVSAYMNERACFKFNPHPLFDGEYYYSQLEEAPKTGQTLVEHYIDQGAAAELATSPLFSTVHYLENYPDIKTAGVNPLLHFIECGMNEGRLPLPIAVRDLESRVKLVLNKDSSNPFGLAYQALCLAKKGLHQTSADTLECVRSSLPPAIYLQIEILCLILAGHIDEAEDAFQRFNSLPTVLSGENAFSGALEWAGSVAEENNDIETAAQLYWLAFEKNPLHENSVLHHLASLQMKVGNLEKCEKILSKLRDDRDENTAMIVNMLSVKACCQLQGTLYTEIYPERQIEYAQLQFLDGRPNLTAQPGSLTAPPLYWAIIEDCIAFSKCNLILYKNNLVYDTAVMDSNANAVLGDQVKGHPVVISRHHDQALLNLDRIQTTEFESGLMMFGVQSANYGHWFLEYLPRMLAYDDESCKGDYPIIIDANMPRSHLDLLRLLNVNKRPVIQLEPDTALHFERLCMAPVPAYFPLDVTKGPTYDTIWPRDTFRELKRRIISSVDQENRLRKKHGRKIFISRRNFNSRQLVNEVEIESFLSQYGFETICPEKLNIREQIEVFRSASIVIGSCSSALTNAIFCEPGTRIVGLIHDGLDFNFHGYSSFIESGGAEILFVRGEKMDKGQNYIHSLHMSYTVSRDKVKRALEWAMA